MMETKLLSRKISTSCDDACGSDSSLTKEEEKTIPFLRRLVDMLKENENVISFYPGSVNDGEVTLGKIVVHDRLQVEATILPKYFNHSSFASLRRQLNYFCFTRMGKGRQRGATYYNEGVIFIDDILRLKRRSSVGGVPPVTPAISNKRDRSASLVSASSSDDSDSQSRSSQFRPSKKARSSMISPGSSAVNLSGDSSPGKPRIALDLTIPATRNKHNLHSSPSFLRKSKGEADVLAGCRALLSFSRSSTGEIVA